LGASNLDLSPAAAHGLRQAVTNKQQQQPYTTSLQADPGHEEQIWRHRGGGGVFNERKGARGSSEPKCPLSDQSRLQPWREQCCHCSDGGHKTLAAGSAGTVQPSPGTVCIQVFSLVATLITKEVKKLPARLLPDSQPLLYDRFSRVSSDMCSITRMGMCPCNMAQHVSCVCEQLKQFSSYNA